MNENKIYKEYKNKMKISPEAQRGDSTNAVVYSFDLETSKFSYELKKNGEPFSLATASDVNFVLRFGGSNPEEYPTAVLIGDIEDRLNGKVSFVMPKRYLGFDGRVLGEVNIQFTNGQSLTAGHFSFVMKPSYIDEGVEIAQQVYVERFEDLESLIGKQSEEIDKTLSEINTEVATSNEKIEDIKKKIEDNDVVTKPQAGNFDDFREQDKSLIEKMKNEFEERGINVANFGAKGDGETDDTLAINNAIKYAHENNYRKVVINNGVCMIKAHVDNQTVGNYLRNEGGIEMLDNITLHIKSGAKLKAITNNKKAYNIIRAHRKDNWSIIVDGVIEGDADTHTGVDGEWGYGISVQGCSNFLITGSGIIHKCWGDGINLQRSIRNSNEDDGYFPKNGIIENITSDKNGRQGMSIEEGQDIYVKNATFSNSNRIAPKYGICIEPAWRNEQDQPVNNNITVDNCKFIGNHGGGITTVGTTINNDIQLKKIVIKNCSFEGNGENLDLKTGVGISGNRSDLEVKNCSFGNNQSMYVASCRYVDIFNVDMFNATLIFLSDFTDKYDIKTTLNVFDSKIRIVNSKTNKYSSVVFTAMNADFVRFVGNTIFYNDTNMTLLNLSGDANAQTENVVVMNNSFYGGGVGIKHQFVGKFEAFNNDIINTSSSAFNSNGYDVSFKGNNVANCQKGIFLFCNNDKESICDISNNNFDVLDRLVLNAYQANNKFTLFSLGNKSPKNKQFMEAGQSNSVSDNSITDVHNPQILTVKNQSKLDDLQIGTLFLDNNTGWIMYKSFNGLHKITTTKT